MPRGKKKQAPSAPPKTTPVVTAQGNRLASVLKRVLKGLMTLGDKGPKVLGGLALVLLLLLAVFGSRALDWEALLEGKVKLKPAPVERHGELWDALVKLAGEPVPELTLVAEKRRYRVGEELVLTVRNGLPGHLNVVTVSRGEEKAPIFFPNRYHPESRVEAGELRLPTSNEYAFTAGLPEGISRQTVLVVALLSEQPINLYADEGVELTGDLSQLVGADALHRGLNDSRGFDPEFRPRGAKLELVIVR